MRKLSKIALTGIAAAAIATTTAVAADSSPKTLQVPLADGSTVSVQYYGEVPPKVTVMPAKRSPAWSPSWIFPEFADFGRMISDMNRRAGEMMRRMDDFRAGGMIGGIPAVNLASSGNLPAGTSSVSVVTVSNGGKSCTRTTEVVSQGAGKPPKVTSNVSGDCGPAPVGSQPAAPSPPTV